MAASGKAGGQALARVWSDAIFKLAAGQGLEDALLEEWRGVVAILDRDPRFEALLASPLVTTEEKRRLIEKAFRGKASDLLVDALQVLGRKGRLNLLRAVADAFHAAWMESKGKVEVLVTTAVALSPGQRQQLVAAASRFAGKEAQLVEKVDPEILGGLVVKVGDDKFDDSVGRELEQLTAAFAARGGRELQRIQEYIHNSEASSRGV
jgi:F-type H+-transporting ATPase subunit delta